ncbi:MAG: GAF domain-containing protein [Chloroflexi bacterium]|nr:GAF domain-containing protein [Chloroflexota bacterium]
MARAVFFLKILGDFQRLNLWPRLVIAATLGFLVLFAIFSLLSLRAVNDSTNRILQERLVVAQMAAREIDRLVARGFHELEKATEFAAFDPRAPNLAEEYHMLAHAYGRVGTLSLGIYFLDAQGRVVLSEPPDKLPRGTDLSSEAHISRVKESGRRSVSAPFIDPSTGQPAVALTVPILGPDGTLMSMLSGLIHMASVDVVGALQHARDLGDTGHAELVDGRGLIIASTDYGGFLQPGEHLGFYLRMFQSETAAVENVPYSPWHAPAGARRQVQHVMAFAPVPGAAWGVAVGGTDRETFAPVARLRNNIIIMGALSLGALWALTLLGARLLVRPVRTLTGAARRMASGNLAEPVHIGEGGEIGVLGASLEAMRAQLKASLERVRTWGEELEVKVAQRTEELTARNRQLAAVSAVATAANEARDREDMLSRCLDVVLEHTRMEAAAIRLVDGGGDRLAVATALGEYSSFPCMNQAIGLDQCPCGQVASHGTPVYLTPEENQHLRPACQAPQARVMAILPLKSSKGVLGVLSLSRSHGAPPSTEDRVTLEAICNQIAVAIENTRLLGELGRVQAQRELDRMKAEFISAISHELRTPLGFIKGYATTLLRDDIAIDAATRQEFLKIVAEESGKLQRMIDELLDASRLQAGGFPLNKTAIGLRELLEGPLKKASAGLQQAGYVLEARLPTEEVQVLADPARIEQVLHNLLDNAARYSDPGSRIEVTATVEDGQALVSVRDHGDGIPAQELERVFEPFYRGDNSRRRKARGTGLGLTICRGIVESHGGRLSVESSPGKGSTFLLTLPLVAQSAAEA